ncbi:MAG: hypothetical protein VYE73_06765 [Acidobacteriota bacterium]|nr:hypothetical protein [Acidobacteriota bacterium]
MKRLPLMAAVAALIAALGGHVYYWYWPRERPARPRPGSQTATLAFESDRDLRLWLPFPHQNLAALRRASSSGDELGAVIARMAGVGDVDLPGFGPFDLPPSRSLAVAVDEGGEGLAVSVEMYPSLALLSRLAGRVAGNSFLAGGPVFLDDRRFETSWSGRTWTIEASVRGTRIGRAADAEVMERGLAFVVLGSARDPFPTGRYVAGRDGDTLVVRSVGQAGRESTAPELFARDLAVVGIRRDVHGTSVLVMPPTRRRASLWLPDAAILWRGAEPRWTLPGHRIARFLRMDPVVAEVDGWSILAREEAVLPLATSLARGLRGTRLPRFALSIQPRLYGPLVATIASITENLPLVPRDEARYWRNLHALVSAAPEGSRLVVRVDDDDFVEVRAVVFDSVGDAP